MSVKLVDVSLPSDWLVRFGRKDAWHGDTHSPSGAPLPEALGKPRILHARWYPNAVAPDDVVEEIRITYSDGEVVRVPAEDLKS